jgi:hypothetical protein
MGQGIKESGLDSGQKQEISLFSTASRPIVEPYQASGGGVLHREWSGRNMNLITHFYLLPRLGMLYIHSPHSICWWWCSSTHKENVPFSLSILTVKKLAYRDKYFAQKQMDKIFSWTRVVSVHFIYAFHTQQMFHSCREVAVTWNI